MFSKKNFILILSLSLLTLTLSGCFWKDTTPQNDNTNSWTNIVDTNTVNNNITNETTDSNKTIKCKIVDPDWQITEAYIDWNLVYFESMDQTTNQKAMWLSKEDKLYFWDETSPKGFVVELSKIQDDSMKIWTTAIRSTKDIIQEAKNSKNECSEEKVSASLFELPANITF
jgi:hypothetical protein